MAAAQGARCVRDAEYVVDGRWRAAAARRRGAQRRRRAPRTARAPNGSLVGGRGRAGSLFYLRARRRAPPLTPLPLPPPPTPRPRPPPPLFPPRPPRALPIVPVSPPSRASLSNYNQELVSCIEDLREKREELNRSLLRDEEEKAKIQKELSALTERLARLNEDLARKMQARVEFDQTIQETEAAYMKILESSQTREGGRAGGRMGGLAARGRGARVAQTRAHSAWCREGAARARRGRPRPASHAPARALNPRPPPSARAQCSTSSSASPSTSRSARRRRAEARCVGRVPRCADCFFPLTRRRRTRARRRSPAPLTGRAPHRPRTPATPPPRGCRLARWRRCRGPPLRAAPCAGP